MYQTCYIIASPPNEIPNNLCYVLDFTPVDMSNGNFITYFPIVPKKESKTVNSSIKFGRKSTGKHETAAGINFASRLRDFCGRELSHTDLKSIIKQMKMYEKYSHVPPLNRDCTRAKVAFYTFYQQYENEIFQAISNGEVTIQQLNQ